MRNCVRQGCSHPEDAHDQKSGTGCQATDCPCPGFLASRETIAPELPAHVKRFFDAHGIQSQIVGYAADGTLSIEADVPVRYTGRRADDTPAVHFVSPRDVVLVPKVTGCARCGGTHAGPILARKLDRPFAPPEAHGLEWTHWFPCPTNDQPVLVIVRNE